MIAITTSSSISVNPERGRTVLPIPVGLAVDALAGSERKDVEHIVAIPGIVGRARVAALSPGGRGGKRRIGVEGIARDAAQEVDHRLLRALLVVDALGELLELLGIARVAYRLPDSALVRSLLVGVDRVADLAQRAAQLLLLGALNGKLADGQRDRCEQRHDRHGDDELDQGEASRGDSRSATAGHRVWARLRAIAVARRRKARAYRPAVGHREPPPAERATALAAVGSGRTRARRPPRAGRRSMKLRSPRRTPPCAHRAARSSASASG